jgi:aldehyde:ferredoxin oxidoreductase
MKTLAVTTEPVSEIFSAFGGRAMTSAIINNEVDPLAIPLGPANKLVFAAGLLGGSAAPVSGHLSVGAKSPLTGGIKESNSGGQAGQILARLGIRALIIEDKPETSDKCYTLELRADGATLVESSEPKGLGNYDTVAKLVEKYGDRKVGYITIGMAGEFGMTAASIAVTDREIRPTRHAGRGGLGAVMGSKCLKAIYLDDSEVSMRQPKDKEAFKAASKNRRRQKRRFPPLSFPSTGTAFRVQ